MPWVDCGDGCARASLGAICSLDSAPRAVSIEADVTDAAALGRAIAKPPPRGGAPRCRVVRRGLVGRPHRALARERLGTVNLLEAVRTEAAGARVLVVSTGDVYGQADGIPTPETAPDRPMSPYAASKAAAELAAEQFRHAGLDVVIARAFQHEGPGRDERFAVGRGPQKSLRRRKPGGGGQRRRPEPQTRHHRCPRRLRAYEAPARPRRPAGTYNVASETLWRCARCSSSSVAGALRDRRREDPSRFRVTEVTELSGDASKLRDATGWAPTIPLEKTLADTLDAARAAVAERMASA